MARPADIFANNPVAVIVDPSTILNGGRDGVARGRHRGRFERNA
ncbi:hypothetical protein [uncultured Aeromicrobium sp.]|nr:hypothetical protein [uncultured Aeromicrobium sp.]